MNKKQITFLLAAAVIALIVPWYAVGMLFMGMAIGGFITIVIRD